MQNLSNDFSSLFDGSLLFKKNNNSDAAINTNTAQINPLFENDGDTGYNSKNSLLTTSNSDEINILSPPPNIALNTENETPKQANIVNKNAKVNNSGQNSANNSAPNSDQLTSSQPVYPGNIEILKLSRDVSTNSNTGINHSNLSSPASIKHSLTPQLTPLITDYDPGLPITVNFGNKSNLPTSRFNFRLPTTGKTTNVHADNRRLISGLGARDSLHEPITKSSRTSVTNVIQPSNLNENTIKTGHRVSSIINNNDVPISFSNNAEVVNRSYQPHQHKAYYKEVISPPTSLRHQNDILLDIDPEASIDGEVKEDQLPFNNYTNNINNSNYYFNNEFNENKSHNPIEPLNPINNSIGESDNPVRDPHDKIRELEVQNELINQQTITKNGDHSIYKKFLLRTQKQEKPPTLTELTSMARQLRQQTNKKMDLKHIHVNIEELDLREAKKLFLKVLGKGLFSVGLPMHVTEFYVILAGQRLGIHVNLMSLMTSMFITFGADTTTHLIQPDKPGLSLSKMVDICLISESIIRGDSTYEDSMAIVQSIVSRSSSYPNWTFLPSMFVMSLVGTPLFNGGLVECLVAGLAGLLIGLLELYSSKYNAIALSRGHDLITGLIASILASITYNYIHSINVLATVFGGIFWALPGLRAVLAMTDLSTNNPITGTAKLFSTIITMLNLGIGVAVGLELLKFVNNGVEIDLFTQSTTQLPVWVSYISLLLCSPPMMVLLDAKKSHFLQLLLGSAIAYTVASLAANSIGNAFGTYLAAFSVGLMSNLYGRYTPSPAIELYLYSIIMLVPGSIGVKSILANDTLDSVSFFFQMLEIAIAIVTGMFSANIFIPPLLSM